MRSVNSFHAFHAGIGGAKFYFRGHKRDNISCPSHDMIRAPYVHDLKRYTVFLFQEAFNPYDDLSRQADLRKKKYSKI